MTQTIFGEPYEQLQPLTPEQFEEIGAEFDAIRNRVRADLGERDATYIRKLIKRQRRWRSAAA